MPAKRQDRGFFPPRKRTGWSSGPAISSHLSKTTRPKARNAPTEGQDMTEAIKSPTVRLLPPAAGRFGERSLADRIGGTAQRPSGCPSVDQFEARMTVVGAPRRVA